MTCKSRNLSVPPSRSLLLTPAQIHRYGHLNNSIYQHLIDSVANTYLARHCSHSPTSSPTIGLVVHSHCDYFSPTSFPAVLNVGLRVNRLGKSSVVYEIAIFEDVEEGGQEQQPAVVGEFVHVFVDRYTGKPLSQGMELGIWRGLEGLRVESEKVVGRELKL